MTTTLRPQLVDPALPATRRLRKFPINEHVRQGGGRARQQCVAPIRDYSEKNSRGYEPRVSTLLGHASEENIAVSDMSIKDFNFFVDAIAPSDKAMLAITDDGHIRGTWREQRNRLSLEFMGNRVVHYVVFIQGNSDKVICEDSGTCSLDEMVARTKDWELWDMVVS